MMLLPQNVYAHKHEQNNYYKQIGHIDKNMPFKRGILRNVYHCIQKQNLYKHHRSSDTKYYTCMRYVSLVKVSFIVRSPVLNVNNSQLCHCFTTSCGLIYTYVSKILYSPIH